ncbi:hypothetical protein STCU_08454 [Strigomonas culicis]|uniref:VASt domain-containing protein n=1 Tax=Strigomonas culicis TaxID=28005 RepID=S9VFE1_9TRYP|nr:hypothetical protein STCU_08454 [Strigomonas culicis]|eukprot:EPY21865.1 hypothetical protein STCU_08454 [Strigomonas culicis]
MALVPVSGQTAEQIFAAQKYTQEKIASNMFSALNKCHEKKMLPTTKLPGVTIQKLWSYAFENNTPFMGRYHESRRETNLVVGPWEYAADRGSGYRVVSLTTLVEVPRSGTPTPLNEAHRFAYIVTPEKKLLLVLHISSNTPEVPAGGTFRTEAILEFTADTAESDCSVTIFGNCKKMSLAFAAIQYIATPRAIREMTAAYKAMIEMLSKELCNGQITVIPASNEGDSTAAEAGGTVADSAADGSGGSQQEMAFQGFLLLLALLVTLVLLLSLSSLRSLARYSRVIAEGPAHRGPPATAAFPSSVGEDESLMYAAQESQLQSLRTRWLDQRTTITNLERSLSHYWWYNAFLTIAMVSLFAKVFFFS